LGPRRIESLRSTIFLKAFSAYLELLVHPSARTDPFVLNSHRTFIATRLLGGLGALAILPIHLAVLGPPTLLETIGYTWFLLPLVLVWDLSRNGVYGRAQILSAITLACMVGLIASLTGGSNSFALPWLVIIPFEAALYASRRTTIIATAFSAFVAAAIAMGDALGLFPTSFGLPDTVISPLLVSTISATLYSGLIALGTRMTSERIENENFAEEVRNRAIAENTRELVTSHGRNGAVTFASPAAEQLLGVPPQHLMGHSFFDRIHVADRPIFLIAIAETAAKGEATTVEYRLRYGALGNGGNSLLPPSFIWVETRCCVGSSESGGQHVIAITSDISRRKADEIAIETARVEAQRTSDAKDRLLATVSHELRTPLNAIIGFSEILSRESTMAIETESRQEYARLIRDSGEHLLAVVNGILDVSQIESGNFIVKTVPFAVGELIESCREMMALQAEQSGVTLAVELAPGLPEVVADKRALRQVLLNLLSNAIKFTDRGGKVTVSGCVERSEFVLAVTDSGIGIAQADLEYLGSPFFQARLGHDRPSKGTGLGLSVVKGLIELHRGHIKIESGIGKGTRVSVRLPLESSARNALRPAIENLPVNSANTEAKRMKRRA